MPVRVPVALLVLALGLTAGLVALAVSSAPGGPPTGRAAASTPSAAAAQDRVALTVLHRWDERRAAAWAAGDPSALARLYVAGSSAGSADVALLRRYAGRGLTVHGIRMQVLRARVLAAGPHRIRLQVTDRLAAAVAVQVTDAGSTRRLPADAPTTRELVLRRVGDAWLMARVSGPRSAGGR